MKTAANPKAGGLAFGLVFIALLSDTARAQEAELVKALRELDANVVKAGSAQAKDLREMLGSDVRARRNAANQRESAAWEAIKTKAEWEKYRDQRLAGLRESLGRFPPIPKDLHIRTTGKVEGDGFTILNLLYESRPGLWVTANLYQPKTAASSMPGIIICHSHHNPKTQGELQDMGMTWARQGCLVLIPDQLGHGERRQHPFTEASKYPGKFRPSRQDYHFRYNVGMQLHLIGDSLIGWMVWDLMRGVDLLLQQKGVDPKRILLLGAVAGGGDPCAVTAALDQRIAAAVPFNFGGPQPESRYPLPKDAQRMFNYAGGGSWESTRNLRLSCRDGFLPWVIVGGVAPRGLVYAHEFSWDRDNDPVWTRLQKIYGFYDAGDHLAFVAGRGAVTGKPPESTHCNNIGAVHRQPIYAAFKAWFDMPIPSEEYQKHVPAEALKCVKPGSPTDMKPVHVLAREIAVERSLAFQKKLAALPPEKRRGLVQNEWAKLLGDVTPRKLIPVLQQKGTLASGVEIHRILLSADLNAAEQAISIPVLLLLPPGNGTFPVVVSMAQAGKGAFVKDRAEAIARLLSAGVAVCLPDVRGTGETRPDASRGRQGASTAISSMELMVGGTLLGARVRDLRSVIHFLATTTSSDKRIALWGDSFAPANPSDVRVDVPLDADKLPASAEPLGTLLALFSALYEKDVRAVYAHGGLVSYASVLDSPFCYLPHDVIVPGALTAGDMSDVISALGPCPTRVEGTVTGLNQRLLDRASSSEKEVADWLIGQLQGNENKSGTTLFNGKDLSGWTFRGGKEAAKRSKWSVVGGVSLAPKMSDRFEASPGTGVLLSGGDGRGVDLLSKREHGDCELHVEFNVPRGSNSGIYFQGQYEVQILDSFGKKDKELKYGDCGGIYNTAPPRVNASRAPGEWQTFDITFRAPRFDAKGTKIANARFLKVVHNGKVIHEDVEVKGPTTASLGGAERPLGPLMIQGDHGPVALRNVIFRELRDTK